MSRRLRPRDVKRCRTAALALLLCVGLAACGGGGKSVLGVSDAAGASSTPIGPSDAPNGSPLPRPVGSSAASRGPVPAASPPQATSVGGNTGQSGSVTGTTQRPSAAPSASHPAAATSAAVEVSDADDGRTLHATRGQQVHVKLSNGTYNPPQSDNSAVLARRTTSGGYPRSKPAEATFEAVAAGSAQLSATTDAACLHAQPRCLIAQRTWHVNVIVS